MFLIDSNIPFYLSLFHTPEFVNVADIGIQGSDSAIWRYGKSNNAVILTKDVDFRRQLLLEGLPPKIVHFKTGNMTVKSFRQTAERHWPTVLTLLEKHALVTVFPDIVLGTL